MAVNRINVLAWAEALESGEFEQVGHHLRFEKPGSTEHFRYCCLGVATELAVRAGVKPKLPLSLLPGGGSFSTCPGGHASPKDHTLWCKQTGTLSPEVQEWLGLNSANPSLRVPEDPLPVRVFRYTATALERSGYLPASEFNDRTAEGFVGIARRIRRVFLNGGEQ